MQKQLVLSLIGQTVNYYRNLADTQTGENNYVEGRGVIISAFLNADKRPMVGIEDGDKRINVDVAMINPSDEAKQAYRDMCEMVDKLVKEHDEKAAEMQKDYNRMIEAAYEAVLGAEIVLVETENTLPA